MLVNFRFSNFTSFFNETSFSMEANLSNEFDQLNTTETKFGKLIKSAFVFGPNGSGKSNFIKALEFMQTMVLGSFNQNIAIKKLQKFKLNTGAANLPALFEVTILSSIDNCQYIYGFEIFNDRIHREWLEKKKLRNTLQFNRETTNKSTKITAGSLKKKCDKIVEYIKPDVLLISSATQLNQTFSFPITSWFSNLSIVSTSFMMLDLWDAANLLQREPDVYAPIINNHLKNTDFNINSIIVKKVKKQENSVDVYNKTMVLNNFYDSPPYYNQNLDDPDEYSLDIRTEHNVYNEKHTLVNSQQFSLNQFESEGTINFVGFLNYLSKLKKEQKVLVVDEIGRGIHYLVLKYIVGLFNSIDNNPLNSQLIATTHDILLLDEDIRRDQIWFTEKNVYGESEMFSLSDFSGVKKNDIKLKKYLIGSYGALPFTKEI